MKKSLIFFISLSFLFTSHKVAAQCTVNLSQAQEAFDNGHLYGIPALLSDCIEKGSTSKQDKIEAYRLLTITYLYIDDPIAAQNSFLALLKLDPEYRVDSTNHIEIVHLSKEYITTPIVSWRARFGVNFNNISTIHSYSSNNTSLESDKYSWGTGYSLIGSFDIHFSKMVSFSLESDLNYSTFNSSNSYFDKDGVQNSKDLVELHEKSWNYGLPISLKFTYPGKKFYPYIYGGYSFNYNINTSTHAKRTNNEDFPQLISENLNLDLSQIRKDITQSFILGVGLKRRFELNYVFVDVRYKIGASNMLVGDKQYSFEENEDINEYSLEYLTVDDDFRQNELNITIGYVWPKYKPRKRKSVTATSFIGGLFKKKQKDE